VVFYYTVSKLKGEVDLFNNHDVTGNYRNRLLRNFVGVKKKTK